MERVDVDRIGSISRLIFGCSAVGGRVSRGESVRAMSAAFAGGVTTFDIARSYGYGDAEQILGSFLKGRRHKAEIITKAGIVVPRVGRLKRAGKHLARRLFNLVPRSRQLARPLLGKQHSGGHFEPSELESSLHASLRALGTDYVDVLLLHGCGIETLARDDIRETLGSFVRRGLVRRVGTAAGLEEASRWIADGGDPTAEVPAFEISRQSASALHADLLVANQPLGGGTFLTATQEALRRRGLSPRQALEALVRRPLLLGAHGVVLSMVSGDHVAQALETMRQPHLSRHEIQTLWNELRGDRDLDSLGTS